MNEATELALRTLEARLRTLWSGHLVTKAFVGRQVEAPLDARIYLPGRPSIPVLYRDLPHQQDVGLVMELVGLELGTGLTLIWISDFLVQFFGTVSGISLLGLWLPGRIIDRAGVPKKGRLWLSDRRGGCPVYRKRGEGLDVLLSQTSNHFVSPSGLIDLGNGWGWE